ncbi:hypothetical protein NARC_100134 [Candidatus Nitrosocosmicus arcticus]|uniref:Uncharacterized protein n=1 Tax=Candidatus Nitrosocosmicus arcticus TaxID=2035267 RepID=A0A557STY6_9ARCH|nr:hypothetical protein NARC_100134 [Candidatus Nitrosocosmicus arcticus]
MTYIVNTIQEYKYFLKEIYISLSNIISSNEILLFKINLCFQNYFYLSLPYKVIISNGFVISLTLLAIIRKT